MSLQPPLPAAGTVVAYDVKELFEKVDKKLDAISEKLDGKADREQVAALESRMKSLEEFKWKLIGLGLGAGAMGAGGVVGVLKALGGL